MASMTPSRKAPARRAPEAARPRDEQVQSLIKGLKILDAFSNAELLGNAELVDRTGYPKATVSRITTTLTSLGYLRRDEASRRFMIGTRLLGIGASVERNMGLLRLARPHMAALALETDMTVSVGTRDRLGIVFLEVVRPRSNRLVINSDAGTVLPLEATAIGLACLAATPVREKARLIEGLQRRHADDWVQVRTRIAAAHEEYLRKGFVSSQKSWGRDVSAVAVPMRAPNGRGLFTFNCSGAASQLSAALLQKRLGPALCAMVERVVEDMQRHPVQPLRPPSVHLP